VKVERLLQNLLGSVAITPISLATIRALEKALEAEFVACGKTWEGVEAVMRKQELERRAKATKAGLYSSLNSVDA
jgi:hypothetical protein